MIEEIGSKSGGNARAKILSEAKKLFIERGFAAVSMADIADAVGIRKPSLYYFFESKAHIYGAIMCDIVKRITPPAVVKLERAMESPPDDLEAGARALQDTLREFVGLALDEGTVVRHKDLAVIKAEYPLPSEVEGLVNELRLAFVGFLGHFGVSQPEIATEIIMSATHSYIFRRKHELINVEPDEFTGYLAGIIIR